MRSHLLFISAAALINLGCLALPASAQTSNLPAPFTKRLVAYYGSWSKEQTPPYTSAQIPYQKLTHIIHAGVNLGEPVDGTFQIPSDYLEPELLTKAHAAGVKVLFTMEGAGPDFSVMAANPAYRKTFVNQVENFIVTYGYDGMDIDWEYPQNSTDRANFNELMKEIRAALPSITYLTSIDVPNIATSAYGFNTLKKYVDMFNIMMYDCAGPWDGIVELNSPIFPDGSNPNPQGTVEQAADDYLNKWDIPAEQLNMGTPFYGYFYKKESELWQSCGACTDNGTPSENYGTFIKQRINKKGWVREFDSLSEVPYLVRADGQPGFITYDDEQSTYERIYYSLWMRGLGGSFMWSLDADYDGSSQDLLDGMYRAVLGKPAN